MEWVKSSLSLANGNCVEVAFRASTWSGANACVEVATGTDAGVLVRNSRHLDGPVLEFTPDEWDAFIGGAKLGEFDRGA